MANKNVTRLWVNLVLGCVLLLASGLTYQIAAEQLNLSSKNPPFEKVPFSEFSYEVGPWRGSELPLSETVLKVANNDDYISRRYSNIQDNLDVTFYLAYTARPVNMDGHRPTVCYVGSGWVHEETKEVEISPVSGPAVSVLIHKFRKPMTSHQEIYVLNYYIVSGQVTTDHKAFSGLQFRKITQSKNNPRYVAQIQISSTSTRAVTEFAKQISPMIWPYLPDLKRLDPAPAD